MSTRLEVLVHELTLSLKVIQKWHRVAFEGSADRGWRDCVFCKQYYDRDCSACPITKYKFGQCCCYNTPYDDWEIQSKPPPRIANTRKLQHLAVKELLFLIKVANHICGLIEKEIR